MGTGRWRTLAAASAALFVTGQCNQTADVLLTGYLPWANFTVNSAGEVAKALGTQCRSVASASHAPFRICFHSILLPVNQTGASH
eukprot:SAG31_NODE_39279_length_289_cov_1.094737_1_plen_84_part_10